MSQPPEQPYPPYQPPYPTPYPPAYGVPPAQPRRRRPSVAWFVVGGVMLVLAPVVFAVSLFLTLRPLAQEDAVLPADGTTTEVSLPAGEERALYREIGSAARCEVTDGSGRPVELRPVAGDFTYNEWRALARFDTGDGDLSFTCEGFPDGRVRIGALPTTEGFVGGLLTGILVPIALGIGGVIVLLVTTILYATGRPRHEPDPAAPPTTTQA